MIVTSRARASERRSETSSARDATRVRASGFVGTRRDVTLRRARAMLRAALRARAVRLRALDRASIADRARREDGRARRQRAPRRRPRVVAFSTGERASEESVDEARMRRALALALDAGSQGEVPIAAVLVDATTGEGVAEAANRCERDGDPTAHAEMLLIRLGAEKLGGWRHLKRTRMYVTLEPCAMCAGAILQSRVGGVTYGARNALLGADGSWAALLRNEDVGGSERAPVRAHPFTPDLDVKGGVLAEETGEAMREFFRRRRTLGAYDGETASS